MRRKVVFVLLGLYGFLKEFRPSDTYIVKYLTGPDKNFTAEQVNHEIFPVCTYANVIFLVFVFLFTDWLRYKPVLIAQSFAAIAIYSIIIWGETLIIMQLQEVLFGLMLSADVSYFTYLFMQAGREHFSDAAAASRVGFLLGRCTSGVVSQACVSSGAASLMDIQYMTLASAGMSAVVVLALPASQSSLYFHKEAARPTWRGLWVLLWDDCRHALAQHYVLQWCIWWAMASAGHIMVLSYVQLLWHSSAKQNDSVWNGAVEALCSVLGAAASWLATRRRSYKPWSGALRVCVALCLAGLVLGAATCGELTLQYVLYALFSVLCYAAFTVTSSEVAQHIRAEAQALVFGLTTLASTLLQTAMVAAVVSKGGLHLPIGSQFLVYGGFFVVIEVGFLGAAVFEKGRPRDAAPIGQLSAEL